MTDVNSDLISSLPTNKSQPTHNELKHIEELFASSDVVMKEFKTYLLSGIFFILISLPQMNHLLYKFLPYTRNSSYFLLMSKAFLFVILYWIADNFWLSSLREPENRTSRV